MATRKGRQWCPGQRLAKLKQEGAIAVAAIAAVVELVSFVAVAAVVVAASVVAVVGVTVLLARLVV